MRLATSIEGEGDCRFYIDGQDWGGDGIAMWFDRLRMSGGW